MICKVFVGVSLDGYIADSEGGLAWLDEIPNPDESDYGYYSFMEDVDAMVMGRKTFETVVGFEGDWPYSIPVYVASRTLETIPESFEGMAELTSLPPSELLEHLEGLGHSNVYIDGGHLITSFLQEDLVDEITLTTVPVVLGGGVELFGELDSPRWFQLSETRTFSAELVQTRYLRRT